MRTRERFVASAAALVLAGGVVSTFTVTEDPPAFAWDARVLPLVDFVEKERGLRFQHSVPVAFLADEEFEQKVASPPAESAEDKRELEEYVGRLRALALLRGPVDLEAAYDDLTGSSVVGLYVPQDKAVFVRGTALTPGVRSTLVHELTHVLQDQYFDLDKLDAAAPGGDTTALTALIEGDAVRVEEAYRDAFSDADQKTYADDLAGALTSIEDRTGDVPEVLSDFLGFPYVFGPVLLDALLAQAGNTEVDRAFRDPPTSEAQVLDPLAYPYTADPVDVPPPVLPPGAKAFGDVGPFGQVFLFDVLGTQLGYDAAFAAVQGWRGDSSQGYRVGTTVCNAADVRMDNAAATTRLATTARRWAARVAGATVTVAGTTVSLRSCDPGARGGPPPSAGTSAFQVLAVRAQILHELTSSGASLKVGRCVADAIVADGRRDGYRSLTSDELSDAALARIQQVAAQANVRCRA